jgi:hypothetical protein
MDISKADIVKELRRELKMREGIYPKWIKSGRISYQDAHHRTEAIRAALTDFETRYFGVQPGLDL